MSSVIKTALFVDYDNVYGSLFEIDPDAADLFGTKPDFWLKFFQTGAHEDLEGGTTPEPRAILARRCYLNPDGFIDPARSRGRNGVGAPDRANAGEPNRQIKPFRQYRRFFARNGYTVIDCPRLTKGKNSADIVMVMDIMEMLQHPTRFDEFIILSADADFTPVLLRLREHDRRTTAFANPNAVPAYKAASDFLVGDHDFIQRALGYSKAPSNAEHPGKTAAPKIAASVVLPMRPEPVAAPAGSAPDPDDPVLQARTLDTVRRMLAGSPVALSLSILGQHVRRDGGIFPGKKLGAFLTKVNDPTIRVLNVATGYAYDPARHSVDDIPPPSPKPAAGAETRPAEDAAAELPASAPETPIEEIAGEASFSDAAAPPPPNTAAKGPPVISPLEMRVRTTIQACCVGMLEHEIEPLSLKELETGVAAATQDDWLHMQAIGSLADLIASLNDARLSILHVGSSYIYDKQRHDPMALYAPPDGGERRLSRPLTELTLAVRHVTNCPILTPDENRALFAAIAAEYSRNTFDFGTEWGLHAFGTAVTGECASHGYHVPSGAVAYVLNALDDSGDLPQATDPVAPERFARAYVNLLTSLCAENRVALTADEITLLEIWIGG